MVCEQGSEPAVWMAHKGKLERIPIVPVPDDPILQTPVDWHVHQCSPTMIVKIPHLLRGAVGSQPIGFEGIDNGKGSTSWNGLE